MKNSFKTLDKLTIKEYYIQYVILNMEIVPMNWNEEKFLNTYKGSEKFVTDGREYYSLFLELLNDEDLLAHIKFCNDVLHVPPLEIFVRYERDYLKKEVFRNKMEPFEKRGIGACFGYLYKFIYGGYESEQSWFNDKETGIKTASYFKSVQ